MLYKAHAVLTRGRSTLEKGYLWIKGKDEGVIRYVDAPAYTAHAAHLASGWQQDHHKAASMLLGSYDLPAYMGHKPHFWTSAASGWETMPDSIKGTEAIAFWRDICASLCFRHHDDDVEMMQVDLRPGLYEGYQTYVRSSRCDCYAYDDLAKLNATGDATAEPEISHEAPNDLAMARFLSTATLVNNYVGTVPGIDEGLRYRRFLNTYAVHRDAWDEFFVVEEQSTVFHKLALEPGYHFDDPDLGAGMAYKTASDVPEIGACMRECAQDYEHRMNFATMVFVENNPGVNCYCIDEDLLLLEHDDRIVHDPSPDGLKIKVYRTKLCVGVAGGSERSIVYRKGVKGHNAVCHGMPVGAGMILANGSMFLSRDQADDTRPVDVQCKSACDANPECAMAVSYVETFSVQQMAHALPPPPDPPAPPMPPPPRVPPLPPMPPGPPPDGIIGLRTWSPATYNSAPEGPDDASNALFYLYCGFGPACDGSGDTATTGFRAPFHKSVSQLSILTTARNMIDQGTYRSSACPYECSNAVRSQTPNLLHMSNLVVLSTLIPIFLNKPFPHFSWNVNGLRFNAAEL